MNAMLLSRRQSSISLSDDYVTEAPLTVLQPFLIFIEEMISADVNPQKSQTSIKKPSRSPGSRVCVLKLYFSFVFVFIRGELKCCNPPPPDCRSSDSTWGGRSSLWFWEQRSEAALGSVVVTDLNRANVGGRLFPYGSLFSSTLGRLGSENLLPLLSSPTSSVQCEAVTQLRDEILQTRLFQPP